MNQRRLKAITLQKALEKSSILLSQYLKEKNNLIAPKLFRRLYSLPSHKANLDDNLIIDKDRWTALRYLQLSWWRLKCQK